MAGPASIGSISYADYLAREEASRQRHEFVRGHVLAMAGGTPEHAALEASVARELGNLIEEAGRPCRVYSANLRVRVQATDFAGYPDATVVCGALETSPDDRNAALNPTVIVEILSDSTESYDRGVKAGHYRHIASIREYILVSQHTPLIEVWRKNDRAQWEVAGAYGKGQSAPIESLGVELSVDRVFAGVRA